MKTLSELCKEFQINKEEVLRLYSIACEITERKELTDIERLYTSIYAILRREGKINEKIREEIGKYVDKTLLRKLNVFCEKCIDFGASMKKFVLENFDLTDEQKVACQKEYNALLEQFKNKTLTWVMCAALACIALQKANVSVKVEEFAKKAGITATAMRYWARKLLKTRLKIKKEKLIKLEE